MSDARSAILARIREQLDPQASGSAEPGYGALPRDYTQRGVLKPKERIELLLERLRDYDAEVIELAEADVMEAVTAVLLREHESVLLVPSGLSQAWLPRADAATAILRDGGEGGCLPREALNRAQAVLTTCAGAIAETGTLLLVHSDAAQGRRALTLLPDHHICILRRDHVVETVAEGLAILAEHGAAAITTISGPSATADIEMTRIHGVHGPRRLTVLLMS